MPVFQFYSQPDCMKQCTDNAGYFMEIVEENLGMMKATAVIMIAWIEHSCIAHNMAFVGIVFLV